MASSRYHNFYEDGAVCFWTSAIVAHIPIFSSRTAALMLVDVLDARRTACGVKLIGYVIMPDHIHFAAWAEKADAVERFISQVLGISSSNIAAMTQRAAARGDRTAAKWLAEFQARARGNAKVRVWKERGRAFPVTDSDALRDKLNYMHANPVEAGLVARAEDWEFSSAAWYAYGTGPLRIDDFEF